MRHSLADIRRGKSKGKWLQKSVLSTLQEKWKTDDEFLKKSERNKKNIAANVDGRVNHSGSVSIPESKRRLEKKLGREASFAELFKTLNYDKSKDKWHTPASEEAIEKFDKILESKSQNGEEVDMNALFLEVNGGINKKGRSWGFGAAIKCHSSTTSTACSKSKFTPPIPDEVEVLKSRLDSMAEENGQLKSPVNVMQDQLTSVMSLLQKFTGTQLNNPTTEDVPSTSDGDDEDMHADD